MAKSPLSPRAQAKLVELIRDNSIHVEEYNPHEECPDGVAIALFGAPLPNSLCSLCGSILEGEQLKLIYEDKNGDGTVYYMDHKCYEKAKQPKSNPLFIAATGNVYLSLN